VLIYSCLKWPIWYFKVKITVNANFLVVLMAKQSRRFLVIPLLISNLLVACTGINFSEWRFPYMYPVSQGNYLNQAQLSQLQLGMTRDQVAFVAGNPVSQFMFNSKQWQYIFQQYKNDKLVNSYVVNIDFNQAGLVEKIESAGLPFNK
jgi:outer membrane protein assembly factor BamE